MAEDFENDGDPRGLGLGPRQAFTDTGFPMISLTRRKAAMLLASRLAGRRLQDGEEAQAFVNICLAAGADRDGDSAGNGPQT